TDRPAMILDRGPDPPPRSAMSRVGVLALLLLAGVLTATALAAGDTQPQPPDRGGKDPRPPVVQEKLDPPPDPPPPPDHTKDVLIAVGVAVALVAVVALAVTALRPRKAPPAAPPE